jgi:hypothetical protein
MRLSVDSRTAEFISSRAAGFRHPISRIEELAIDLGVLPLWVDWTVFLAIGSDGRVLMVDHEAAEPNLRPANDLTFVAIALVEGAARYPELASFLPVRPPGRGPCTTCGGAGTLSMSRGSVVLHCICGGLGWKPETPAELGLVGSPEGST